MLSCAHQVLLFRRVARSQRASRIARRSGFVGCRERNRRSHQRNQLLRSADRRASEVPACIGCDRHSLLDRSDSGSFVAIIIDLGHQERQGSRALPGGLKNLRRLNTRNRRERDGLAANERAVAQLRVLAGRRCSALPHPAIHGGEQGTERPPGTARGCRVAGRWFVAEETVPANAAFPRGNKSACCRAALRRSCRRASCV